MTTFPGLANTGLALAGLGNAVPRAGAGIDRLVRAVAEAVAGWTAQWWPVALPSAAAVVVAVAAAVAMVARWRSGRQVRHWHTGARLVTILPPPRVDPDGAAALWANLVGLLRPRWQRLLSGQPHLGFEYLISQNGIQIRMWVPGAIPPGLVEQAVSAAWPGARTHTAPVPPPPRRSRTGPGRSAPSVGPDAATSPVVAAGGELRLARGDALPISHDGRGPDPIRAMLAAPGPLGPGETASVQILARPVTGRRLARLTQPNSGDSTTGAVGAASGIATQLARAALSVLAVTVREALSLLAPGLARRPAARRTVATRSPVGPRERLVTSAQDRAAAAKARGGAYATVIRYATTTPAPEPASPRSGPHNTVRSTAIEMARDRARAITRGRAHAIASAFAGFGDHNHYRRHRLTRPLHALQQRRLGRGDVLSIGELAAIAHLPTDEHVPGLQRAGAAAIAPPPQIPLPGPGVKLLGDSDTRTGQATGAQSRGGRGRPVGLAVTDARHHLHVVGATGSGKSTLLARLVLDDADAGRGVLVIDPKGDLVTDIATRLPAAAYRAGRVVVLDPDHPAPPPSLNPLAPHLAGAAAQQTRWAGDPVVENVVSVFSRLWSTTWGPRTDDVLRVALLTLRAGPDTPTLARIPALLSDPAARYRATRHLHDPLLRDFWRTFDRLSDAARAHTTAPLLNNLRAVLLRPFAARLLASGPSTVSLHHVLDRGGILLARLPKGRLGDDTTRLIGSLILAQAWQATTARAHQPPTARRDAGIVLDECQNFLHLPYSIEDMLAEARGFNVAITLANQHLAQLPAAQREGIATNARNKIILNVGPDDARDLARHTRPQLGEHDLAHLDAFHAAARLVVAGGETPAFTFTTRPLPPVSRTA